MKIAILKKNKIKKKEFNLNTDVSDIVLAAVLYQFNENVYSFCK